MAQNDFGFRLTSPIPADPDECVRAAVTCLVEARSALMGNGNHAAIALSNIAQGWIAVADHLRAKQEAERAAAVPSTYIINPPMGTDASRQVSGGFIIDPLRTIPQLHDVQVVEMPFPQPTAGVTEIYDEGNLSARDAHG